MTSQIVRYVCYYGSSKQSGGGQAYISEKHLGCDIIIIILLAETSIFVGRNVPDFMETRPFTPSVRGASFFSGVRIMLGMTFNYLILWVRVKGQG